MLSRCFFDFSVGVVAFCHKTLSDLSFFLLQYVGDGSGLVGVGSGLVGDGSGLVSVGSGLVGDLTDTMAGTDLSPIILCRIQVFNMIKTFDDWFLTSMGFHQDRLGTLARTMRSV